MGNHRDAWGFGAIDASGGEAAMIEIARAFGQMVKQGKVHIKWTECIGLLRSLSVHGKQP